MNDSIESLIIDSWTMTLGHPSPNESINESIESFIVHH